MGEVIPDLPNVVHVPPNLAVYETHGEGNVNTRSKAGKRAVVTEESFYFGFLREEVTEKLSQVAL
jgi:hypothetical protein